MPGLVHERLVADLVRMGYETGSLGKAVAPMMGDPELTLEVCARVVPDAYLLDHENSVLIAVEVDTGCFLAPRKWANYLNLAWLLDDIYWELLVRRIDRWGNVNDFPVVDAMLPAAAGFNTDPSGDPAFWLGREEQAA